MSDNITNPFDEVLQVFAEARQAAEAAEAQEAEDARQRSAALVTALATQASERTEAQRKAVFEHRKNQATSFIQNFSGTVIRFGLHHNWSEQDFIDAKALCAYLTSSWDAARPSVTPRQHVADKVNVLFNEYFSTHCNQQRKLPKEQALPMRYFQGGRDILAKKPKETGRHVSSQSTLQQSLASMMPDHLKPTSANVVSIQGAADKRRKRTKVAQEATTAS